VDNVVCDSDHGHESQENQEGCQPPQTGVRRQCIRRDTEEWPDQGESTLVSRRHEETTAKRFQSG
jgi:hypothetical protein